MMIKVARHCVRVSYLVIGVLLIVLALASIAARIGLPLVASHKSYIELRVSEYLKSPVEIGELSLRWKGTGPMLYATDVAVFETAERALKLDEVLIDVNLVSSLLRGIPIINELSLVGARLVFETDADGLVRLHGVESIGSGALLENEKVIALPDRSKGFDVIAWLFNANKVSLLDTELILIDIKSSRQNVVEDLNIRAENNGKDHKLRVDAKLPAAFGGQLEAGIDLVGDASALAQSTGNWYVSAESFNISGLTTLLQLGGLLNGDVPAPFDIDALGSAQMWGHWKDGQLVSARGPLYFATVVDGTTEDTILDGVSAQLQITRDHLATSLEITDIQATHGPDQFQLDEVRIFRSTATKALDSSGVPSEHDSSVEPALYASNGSDQQWQMSGKGAQVSLALSARLAAASLSQSRPELARELRNADVSGTIQGFAFEVSGLPGSPSVDLHGALDSLSISNTSTIPAFGPLTGSMSVEDSLGTVQLASEQMPLSWSIATDRRMQIDELAATVDVDLRNLQRLLISADIQLADDGINTSTRIKSRFVPDTPPHLHIQSSFDVEDISRISAWFPEKQLPAVSLWIEEALVAGKATDGSLLFFGNPADFPFSDGEGVFRANVEIKQGELAFLPDWPVAKNINGNLELDGFTLSGQADNGALEQFVASDTQFVISNLAYPVLEFSTTAQGKLQDLANFAVNGPLQDLLEPAIGDMSGTGNTQMDLTLAQPLFEESVAKDDALGLEIWKPFELAGSVFLNNNDVAFGRAELVVENAVGAVGFSHEGITINNLGGNLLGHAIRIAGHTEGYDDAATTTVNVRGALEANDLLAHYGNPLDQFIHGASHWNASITIPHSDLRIADEGVQLTVNSDLIGSELLLPAPFDKGTSVARQFTLSTAFREDTDDQLWDIRYGDDLRTRVRLIEDDLHSMLIELGETDPASGSELLIPEGIRLQGYVPMLAADGWIETIARYIDSIPETEEELEPIIPISVALNTDQMVLERTAFGKASMRVNTDDTYVNFVISNFALSGNMRYPREDWRPEATLKARIELLDWSIIDALAETPDEVVDGFSETDPLDPTILPRIEAKVSLLTRGSVRVRDLILRAEPNISGLDITTLGFAYDTMRLVGQGHWYLRDPQGVNRELVGKHSSQLNLVLQSDDFGVGLEELGLNDIMADGRGAVEMQLSWPGPLYAPELERLDGNVKVDVNSGSIVPFEPGAGRVVGLFALQSLPRRLNLDFKDLTHDGLAFTSISGSAAIENGIADVPLLQLTGPIGVVDIEGTSDLNTQEFDQKVTVLPRVSAAIPIIGAISGGATAGIGALVAAGLLKALGLDFDRIGLRAYSLTGQWTEPVVTPIPADYFSRK